MKTQTSNPKNTNSISSEAVLRLQLNEAMRLIRTLQLSNAELIRQNANLIQISSGSMLNNAGSIHFNEQEKFMNEIFSLINDHNVSDIEHKQSGNDNNIAKKGNKQKQNDNIIVHKEHLQEEKDNKNPGNDDKNSHIDNNTSRIDNNNGQIADQEILLKQLRYKLNVVNNNHYSDEELLEKHRIHTEFSVKSRQNYLENARRKVPALYYLHHPELNQEQVYKTAFENIMKRYRHLKRNRRNDPSLLRQIHILLYLYEWLTSKPQQLFSTLNIKRITGFRHVAKLRKHGFIQCWGRGTACRYTITDNGIKFLEEASV